MELFKNNHVKINIQDLELSGVDTIDYYTTLNIAIKFYESEETFFFKKLNSLDLLDSFLEALEDCIKVKRAASTYMESAGIIFNFCTQSIYEFENNSACHFSYRKYHVLDMDGFGIALYQRNDLFCLEIFNIYNHYQTLSAKDFNYWMEHIFFYATAYITKEEIIIFLEKIQNLRNKVRF